MMWVKLIVIFNAFYLCLLLDLNIPKPTIKTLGDQLNIYVTLNISQSFTINHSDQFSSVIFQRIEGSKQCQSKYPQPYKHIDIVYQSNEKIQITHAVYTQQNQNLLVRKQNGNFMVVKVKKQGQSKIIRQYKSNFSCSNQCHIYSHSKAKTYYIVNNKKIYSLNFQDISGQVTQSNQNIPEILRNQTIQKIISQLPFIIILSKTSIWKIEDSKVIQLYKSNNHSLVDVSISNFIMAVLCRQQGIIIYNLKTDTLNKYKIEFSQQARSINIQYNTMLINFQIHTQNILAEIWINFDQIKNQVHLILNKYFTKYMRFTNVHMFNTFYGIISSKQRFTILQHSINRKSPFELHQLSEHLYSENFDYLVDIIPIQNSFELFVITYNSIKRLSFFSLGYTQLSCRFQDSGQFQVLIETVGLCQHFFSQTHYCYQEQKRIISVLPIEQKYNQITRENYEKQKWLFMLALILIVIGFIICCLKIERLKKNLQKKKKLTKIYPQATLGIKNSQNSKEQPSELQPETFNQMLQNHPSNHA